MKLTSIYGEKKIPILAERKYLINRYLKAVGNREDYSDFCDYEIKLAQFVDAVIIIPATCS